MPRFYEMVRKNCKGSLCEYAPGTVQERSIDLAAVAETAAPLVYRIATRLALSVDLATHIGHRDRPLKSYDALR